jgi:hypothetical protein
MFVVTSHADSRLVRAKMTTFAWSTSSGLDANWETAELDATRSCYDKSQKPLNLAFAIF